MALPADISNGDNFFKDCSRLLKLHDFTLILNSTHNVQEILRQSASRICDMMQADGCHILFAKNQNDNLSLETAFCFGRKPFPAGIDETKGISSLTLETNKIVIVTNAEKDPRVTKALQEHFGHKSLVSVPIVAKGRSIGVLVVYSHNVAHFDQRDGEFLLMLGNHLGQAVENADLMMRLHRAAIIDPLTEVYNYRYFRNKLEVHLKNNDQNPVSLVLIDLNNFKQINDNYGHLVGDYLLQETARILKENVRGNDSVTRNGGDEFALILPGADSMETLRIMKRIEQAFAKYRYSYDGSEIQVSISWGNITTYGEKDSIDKIISLADKRLYKMKKAKR